MIDRRWCARTRLLRANRKVWIRRLSGPRCACTFAAASSTAGSNCTVRRAECRRCHTSRFGPAPRKSLRTSLTRPRDRTVRPCCAPCLQPVPQALVLMERCHRSDECLRVIRLNEDSAVLVDDLGYRQPPRRNHRQGMSESLRNCARIPFARVTGGEHKTVVLPQFGVHLAVCQKSTVMDTAHTSSRISSAVYSSSGP